MRFEGTRPTQHLRETLVAGQIGELVALPVLVTVALLYHHELRWGYLAGAIACVFVSLLYFALFLALTRGTADIRSQLTTGLVMSCLAVATIGLLELGTSNPFGTFMPLCLVIVLFMSIIGDRRMRIAIDCVAFGAVVVVGWVGGLRGGQLAAVILIYGSAVALVTGLTSVAVASLTRRVTSRRSVGALNAALREAGSQDPQTTVDPIQDVLRRGLPLVPTVMPAERITVYTRQGNPGRFVALASWPEGEAEASPDPADLPEVAEALRTDWVVLGDDLCAVPIGYCPEGEMVMVVRHNPDEHADHAVAHAAETVAAAFLRATSRANFASGLRTESRTDSLTGLPTRMTLYERIQIEMEHALRSESPLSVAMIDLDHFKHYNDLHGQVAGDTLLRSIAALVVSNIRGQDFVVRYGGEDSVSSCPTPTSSGPTIYWTSCATAGARQPRISESPSRPGSPAGTGSRTRPR